MAAHTFSTVQMVIRAADYTRTVCRRSKWITDWSWGTRCGNILDHTIVNLLENQCLDEWNISIVLLEIKMCVCVFDLMFHCIASWCLTGVVFGDPHFITSDGLNYTFNGKGEYNLVSSPDRELSIQARTERVKLKNGESTFDVNALSVAPLSYPWYDCSSHF